MKRKYWAVVQKEGEEWRMFSLAFRTKEEAEAGRVGAQIVEIEIEEKIPFDMQKAKAGYPVVNHTGRPVRIVDFDYNGGVCCIEEYGKEKMSVEYGTAYGHPLENLEMLPGGEPEPKRFVLAAAGTVYAKIYKSLAEVQASAESHHEILELVRV